MGTEKVGIVRINGSASYDTGGSTLDLSAVALGQLAMTVVEGVEIIGTETVGAATYAGIYLRATAGAPSTGKLIMTVAGVQVAGAVDLSALIFILKVHGS